jgi:hypothetical protein
VVYRLKNRVLFGKAFERLERYAVKVARTVLRGGSGSNATSLPDHPTGGVCAFSSSLRGLELVPANGVLSSHPPAGNASR